MSWLRRNGVRLLVSLAFSFVLWLFVTLTTNPLVSTEFENVPVVVRGLGANLVIVSQDGIPRQDQERITEVDILIETDRSSLAAVRPDDFQATVDLTERGEGVHLMPIELSTNARNIRILSTNPSDISLRLAELITRTVPITIDVVGNLPFSFERDNPIVRSNGQIITEAVVYGPRNLVQSVVRTSAQVNIEQIRATFISTLALQPYDNNGDRIEGITVTPDQVSVEITVRSVVGLKRVPVLANVAGIPAPGHIITRIQNDPALIDLVGSSSQLNTIDHVDTAPVDISGATATVSVSVPIRFRGAQPSNPEQTTALVVIEIRPLDQAFQAQLPVAINIVGVGPGLLLDYSPQTVLTTFSAAAVDFLQFQTDFLTATVDVSGLGAGSYALAPQLPLPPEIQLVQPLPPVQVTLRLPATPTPLPATPTPPPPPTELPPATVVPPPADGGNLPDPPATPTIPPDVIIPTPPPPPTIPELPTLPAEPPLPDSPTLPATATTVIEPVP
ncbi:MAG: hypothetical protein HC911_01045 [Chloroflexaceae bacterium]|nr:hypothetical protein [Chloroflexaceae bacterium]